MSAAATTGGTMRHSMDVLRVSVGWGIVSERRKRRSFRVSESDKKATYNLNNRVTWGLSPKRSFVQNFALVGR